MSPDRAAQWSRRFERLRRLEHDRIAVSDFAGADRAVAVRRRAQARWSRELFHHQALTAVEVFTMPSVPRIMVGGGRMTVTLPR